MKGVVLALFIASISSANEMLRIQTIVDDISQLRIDYKECQKKLELKNGSVSAFKAEKSNCTQLLEEKKKYTLTIEDMKALEKDLHKKIELQESVLKTKDHLINDLNKKISRLEKSLKIAQTKATYTPKIVKKEPTKQVCQKPKETNKFPKLMMKEDADVSINFNEKIEKVKASSFKLVRATSIYDKINGKKIDRWEKDVSFTSNVRSENWIKITGYFIDKKWLPASKSMWIRAKDTKKK